MEALEGAEEGAAVLGEAVDEGVRAGLSVAEGGFEEAGVDQAADAGFVAQAVDAQGALSTPMDGVQEGVHLGEMHGSVARNSPDDY